MSRISGFADLRGGKGNGKDDDDKKKKNTLYTGGALS